MADPTKIQIVLTHSDGGNAVWDSETLASATPDFVLGVWRMVKDVESSVFGYVRLPKSIGATPAAKIRLLLAANATTGDTRLAVEARPIAAGESVDQAMDTTVSAQDVDMAGTAYDLVEPTFTMPTTGNGFPVAADDLLLVRIFHDGDHANDTLAVDTLLVGAYLEVDLT